MTTHSSEPRVETPENDEPSSPVTEDSEPTGGSGPAGGLRTGEQKAAINRENDPPA